MVQKSSRVYSSAVPPRQRKLRDIMNPPRKSKKRVSAGPVPSLRQETMTQMGFFEDFDQDFDVENEQDEEEEAERKQRERRRKRRRTMGDSPAIRAPLSRTRQETLTQMGFVEPVWIDPNWQVSDEEVDAEMQAHVKREEDSFPIWEDGTAEPEAESRGEELRHTRSRSSRSDQEPVFQVSAREVGDSDEEGDSEVEEEPEFEDNLDPEDETESAYNVENDTEHEGNLEVNNNPDLRNRQYHTHDERVEGDTAVPVEEPAVVWEEEEVGDDDPGSEDVEQDDCDSENTSNLHSSTPPTLLSSQEAQVQVRSSINPPITPRKRRYEVPDSDAESEDISPEKNTPVRQISSQFLPTQSTPTRRMSTLQNPVESSPFAKHMASKPLITKPVVPPSQATTVDHTQYLQSQSTSTQRTPARKPLSREPTKTSPFVLRSSQLLTESQMLPASLMDSMPLPPRWVDSDEEGEAGGRNVEYDDDDDDNEL